MSFKKMPLLSSLRRAICGFSLCSLTALSLAQTPPSGVGSFEVPVYGATTDAEAGANSESGKSGAASAPKIPTIRNKPQMPAAAAYRPELDPASGRPAAYRAVNEQLSEFQKFVEIATGRQLPVFGSTFFKDASISFSPVDNVPVSSDYIVGVGDEVQIRAWGSIDVDYRAIVDRNGQVSLPKVGSFTVAGTKAADLERQLRAQIGKLFTNFELRVTLGQLRGAKVFVVGPARRPGVYTLSSQSTMLSAVVAAGGPGPNGSMRKVQLRRNGQVMSELDIYEFLVHGDKSKDLQLASGDVVVFHPTGPRVAINGILDTPGIYELKSAEEPVRDVFRYAGGTPVLSNPNRVQVERIDANQPRAARFVETFKLDAAGLQKALRDGDVLTLLPISHEFANAVTLKGHVAQPLRYPYSPGMRIKDLIPEKEALITPDFYRRKNLLVQAETDDDWRPKQQENDQPSSNALQRDRLAAERSKRVPAALFDDLNWDYAVVERLNPADLSTQVIAFNLGKAVIQGDPTNNIELQSGDVVTIYSQKDIRVPSAKQTRLVTIEGEVHAPGIYQVMAGETLPQLLQRAGGLTPQAYVYGLEFSREETRKRQRDNVAEAIVRLEALSSVQAARDAANKRDDSAVRDSSAAVSSAATQAQIARLKRVEPNGRIALELPPEASALGALPELPLENADRIVVPARPGFITVAGAVVNNNALLWKQERKVGDYIRLAGLDEAAEPDHMFVVRADGTVVTAQDHRGFLGMGGGLNALSLYPGDAIVVPNKLDYETWGRVLIRNLKDWSQILSQFGLGAAAIQTLRRD